MNGLYPLKLAVIPDGWRLFYLRQADKGFAPFKQQVLVRDGYTCRYCGFKAKEYQEIVNLDNNYFNNKLANLATACPFCTQCFFLEAVGKGDYGGGTLIYLPEMSQGDLNGLCHVLFCAMSGRSSYLDEAQNIYREFKNRAKIVKDRLGEGMSDASLLGRMLIDCQAGDRKKIEQEILSSLKLLPLYSKFGKQLEVWSSAIEEDLTT